MKAVVFLCGILACASALPAPAAPVRTSIDELFDDIFGPITTDRAQETSSESDSEEFPSPAFPVFMNPFSSFFNPFSFVPDFSSLFRPIFISTDASDNKVLNSTSETKVIDGKKMIVNNTYYQNPNSGAILHSIVISYGSSDDSTPEGSEETTPSAEADEPLPNGKKTEDNEVREPVMDHSSDKGDNLDA